MASIDKRANGGYRARWREHPGGPQQTRQFARKVDAVRFLDGIRGDIAHGLYVDPNGGRTAFQEYAERWRVGQLHRPSTATQTETYLRVHAYPTLGRRQLGAIRRSDIQAWVKERTEVLAPGSVELVYRWVATIFKAAVSDRLIAVSPCERIALPKRDRQEVEPLAVEAVKQLDKTILFVTHDIEEALFIGDKLIVLSKIPTSITNGYKLPFRSNIDVALKFEQEFVNFRKEIQNNFSNGNDNIINQK